MGIRQYKPVTAGRRAGSVSDFAELTDKKKKPEKSLLEPRKKKGGRNFQGKVCTRFRGGGHKQMYRVIDFKRNKDGVAAVVESIEYDPNRTCRIALLKYEDGTKAYILAPRRPEGRRSGDERRRRRAARWQRDADEKDSGRHGGAQCRDAAGQGRADLPQRRHGRDAVRS